MGLPMVMIEDMLTLLSIGRVDVVVDDVDRGRPRQYNK